MIEIKNLSYRYAGAKNDVLSGLDIRLEENRIYGLLGKNGTGKSTLLYLISGLLRRTAGSVVVDGNDPAARGAELLSEIFVVPEEFDLPAMTLDAYVRVNEAFYPRFSREVLGRCLRDFELSNNLNLKELSMGQKKKVYMSFALAANTRLLLMDEPTNGLDIPSKSQFRKVVAGNMSEGRTLVISTHQVHDVEALLDHVIIIGDKRVMFNASAEDITSDYTFDYRQPAEMDGSVVYAEPSLQGNAVMARREAGDAETQINLELLFNAVTQGHV